MPKSRSSSPAWPHLGQRRKLEDLVDELHRGGVLELAARGDEPLRLGRVARVENVAPDAAALAVEAEDVDAAEQRGLLGDARLVVGVPSAHECEA